MTLSYKTKAYSTSFDDIITEYYPKANVNLATDTGIKIDINIEINPNNDILLYVDFYYNNVNTHYKALDPGQLALLVNAYYQYIIKLVAGDKQSKVSSSSSSWFSLPNIIISLIRNVKNVKRIRKVLQRYQDLRSVNLFTIYGYTTPHNNKKIIARTTIELDGDIITVIPEEMLKLSQLNVFMNLHRANVFLANQLFLYPIIRIFMIMQAIKSVVRIVAVPAWIILSIILFPHNAPNNYIYYIYSIVTFVGIPIFLFKSIPKILGYLIRSRLRLV